MLPYIFLRYFYNIALSLSPQIRLQYITGIDNAPGVTSTKLEPLPGSASGTTSAAVSTSNSAAVSRGNSRGHSRGGPISSAALAAAAEGKLDSFSHDYADGAGGGATFSGINLSGGTLSRINTFDEEGNTISGVDSAALDPNSAYFIVSTDPSQAFRKHLSKRAGITPGKILAARRKENAIQRARKTAEEAELK